MKKLTMNIVVVLTMITLLQLVAVGGGNFSQIDESSNMIGQADQSITFFDSNDVNDANNVVDVNDANNIGDVNDVNDPDQTETNE